MIVEILRHRLHHEIDGEMVTVDRESINAATRRENGFNFKVTAAHDGRDGEAAGHPTISELVFEHAYGHISEFADGVIHHSVPAFDQFFAGYAEHLSGRRFGEFGAEIKIDQPLDFTDETNGADHMR